MSPSTERAEGTPTTGTAAGPAETPVDALCARMLRLERPSALTVRHDGLRIAAMLSAACAAPGEGVRSRIRSIDFEGHSLPLTHGPGADVLPSYAPADGRLAFASDRAEPGRFAVYVLGADRPDGPDGPGELAGPYVAPDGTVDALRWSRDGASLLCTVAEAGLDHPATAGATPLAWGAAQDPARSGAVAPRRTLFRLDVACGEFEPLLPAPWSAWEACELGGGATVVIASRDGSERGWYRSELLLLGADGEVRTLHRPEWQLQCPTAAPDGRHVAVIEGWASDRGLVAGTVRLVNPVDGTVRTLGGNAALEGVCTIAWRNARSLHFSAWSGHGTRHGVVDLAGRVEWSLDDAAGLGPDRFAAKVLPVGATEAMVAVRDGVGRPAHVVARLDRASDWRTLWAPEADAGAEDEGDAEAIHWPVSAPSEIAWRADDGLRIGALLWMPDGPTSPPPPMIVALHGGPSSTARFGFDPCGALDLVAAGYTVLLPNYRGSAGRGEAFSRANLGDPGGAELGDILSGVRRCVEDGVADPARIGITGVSYGGYLAAWAAAASDRFAAAVVTSGITDLLACHFDSNQAFCELIAGGDPQRLEERGARELMIERSPRYRLAAGHPPTLFLHGSEDRCTPVNQARNQHRSLVQLGIEAELIVYPREGHALLEREHQLDARRRRRHWFDRHLRAAGVSLAAGR